MTPDILVAAGLARQAHRGQLRKYTGEGYIVHPARVAARLTYHEATDEVIVCGAWCHDVIEDCDPVFRHLIEVQLGHAVSRLVNELTNPSKQYEGLSRAERKAMDRAHLAAVSPMARLIKLADRADNVLDLCRTVEQDRKFAALYWEESWKLLEVLRGTDDELEAELVAALDRLDQLT